MVLVERTKTRATRGQKRCSLDRLLVAQVVHRLDGYLNNEMYTTSIYFITIVVCRCT